MQVEYGLEPVVSPVAMQRKARDLRDVAPMELARTAGNVHHPPLDHDTQVLHPYQRNSIRTGRVWRVSTVIF